MGKTEVAIALARRLRARGEEPVAVSADALQVYEGLSILTGAASESQRAELEHRLVGFLPVTDSYSVAEYARRAHAEIDGLLAAGRRPLVVGGTGLYLRAALAQLDLRPPPDPETRRRRQRELAERGAPALHAQLSAEAPWAAATIDPGDGRRVTRALELLDSGDLRPPPAESQLWTDRMRHPTLLAGLTMGRDALHRRIDRRVEAMVAAGAGEEVRRADAAGASSTARQALGFDELLASDVEAMKAATRRYARRQGTWMRKLAAVRTIDLTDRDAEHAAAEIEGLARNTC